MLANFIQLKRYSTCFCVPNQFEIHFITFTNCDMSQQYGITFPQQLLKRLIWWLTWHQYATKNMACSRPLQIFIKQFRKSYKVVLSTKFSQCSAKHRQQGGCFPRSAALSFAFFHTKNSIFYCSCYIIHHLIQASYNSTPVSLVKKTLPKTHSTTEPRLAQTNWIPEQSFKCLPEPPSD